jgi:small subunit ribosomal protein S7e
LSSLSPSLPCRASTVSSSGKFSHPCFPWECSPLTQLTSYSLTRELEKKFSDRHVLILAHRRILPRPKRSTRSRNTQKQKRPRSRTLTAVHDAILTDLVFPVEIVGKRLRTKEDGSKTLKVILDEKERGGVDYRLDTYSEVYKRLTGRGVTFEFPQTAPEY